jgi:hypothetical protein
MYVMFRPLRLLNKRKKDFPVPSRYVTNQTLPGREYLNIPGQGEFGQWHPGWGRENCKPFLQRSSPSLYFYNQKKASRTDLHHVSGPA